MRSPDLSQAAVLPRALAVTAFGLAADWTWWLYGRAVGMRLGQVAGHREIGESAVGHLWFEVVWRLPLTLVSGSLGFVAVYFLLRQEPEAVKGGRGLEGMRLYLGALILVMLVHVLVGLMRG